MPELPEVETTRRGLEPLLSGQRIRHAVVRNRAMRVPVPRQLPDVLAGARIERLTRRGKYLLIDCGNGHLIIHLGMSGRLWCVRDGALPEKHDHFDLVLENGIIVRLRDPRRFGLVLWQTGDPLTHKLLAGIGPEPLSDAFNAKVLHAATRGRSAAIKLVIMDSRVVAGVGNIYASEALFRSGIHPAMAAGRLTLPRAERLVEEIRGTLADAIRAGGSTLRDYVGGDGQAGYFQKEHLVYGRAGEECYRCKSPIRELRQGQRSTFYCRVCQKR